MKTKMITNDHGPTSVGVVGIIIFYNPNQERKAFEQLNIEEAHGNASYIIMEWL